MRERYEGSLVVTLEAAWEPRIRMLKLVQPMADVRAVDDRGEVLTSPQTAAQPELNVASGVSTVRVELPLKLPSRGASELVRLDGQLLATVPGKMETFRFDKLADAHKEERRIAQVTVTLEKVQKNARRLLHSHSNPLRPMPGDALASHRQWIFENPGLPGVFRWEDDRLRQLRHAPPNQE